MVSISYLSKRADGGGFLSFGLVWLLVRFFTLSLILFLVSFSTLSFLTLLVVHIPNFPFCFSADETKFQDYEIHYLELILCTLRVYIPHTIAESHHISNLLSCGRFLTGHRRKSLSLGIYHDVRPN